MGKEKKQSFADKIKAGIAKTTTEATKVAKAGLEAAKSGAEIVADKAEVATKSSVKALKAGAEIVAVKAHDAKEFLDDKTREALDKAYEAKKPEATSYLKRIRKANPDASPAEILLVMQKDLAKAETKSGSETEEFASATTLYVFTAVEVYGKKFKDAPSRQRLIDTTVLIDSEAAKIIAGLVGVGFTILLARFGGKATKNVIAKVAGAGAFASMLNVKNPGKKGASWIAVNAVSTFLGPVPKSWPAEPAPKKK